MTARRDTQVIRATRAQLEQAIDHARTAASIMRKCGLPENADDLMRTVRVLAVWTQVDGWLDCLAAQMSDQLELLPSDSGAQQ
jgi:hypothetical protein